MRSAYQVQIVLMQKFGHNVRPKRIGNAAVILAPVFGREANS